MGFFALEKHKLAARICIANPRSGGFFAFARGIFSSTLRPARPGGSAQKEKPRLITEASAWPVYWPGFPAVRHRDAAGSKSGARFTCIRRSRRYFARLGQHSPPYMLPPILELWLASAAQFKNSCCVMQLTCFDHGAQATVQPDFRCLVALPIIRQGKTSSVRHFTQA